MKNRTVQCVTVLAWLTLGMVGVGRAQGPEGVEALMPQAPACLGKAEPITLEAALRLAQTTNLDIRQAQQVVEQARANKERALGAILPNLVAGPDFLDHQGQLQQTAGDILDRHRQSLYVGFGPVLSVNLSEALFQPLVARQLLRGSQAGEQRVTLETLYAVSDAYVRIVGARRRLARTQAVLEFMSSEKESPLRAGAPGLLPLLKDIARKDAESKEPKKDAQGRELKKDALQADITRVEVEILRRRDEQAGALLEFLVASAELARLVRLPADVPLCPAEDYRWPLLVAGDDWAEKPIEELVRFALSTRPDIAENQAAVQAAVDRLKEAAFRPLLPTLAVSYGYGGFGGGPIIFSKDNKGKEFDSHAEIERFGPRADLDAGVYWRLQNMGVGNHAEVREQRAMKEQLALHRIQTQDRVAAQVVQGRETVLGNRERVQITGSSLFDAKGDLKGPVFENLRLSFETLKGGGDRRPREVLDAVRALNDLLESYVQAVTEYDRSRLRLTTALGLPPQLLVPAAP
jgi:outer membrane protein TolC